MSHHLDANFLKKHVKTGSTEGGACLTRHEKRQENNSCSHIWQAYEKALEKENGAGSIYNWPRYESLRGKTHKTGARETFDKKTKKKKGIFPRGLELEAKGPEPEEWDLTKKGNFQDWRKPYWHNAHHIIPNGVLADRIALAAEGDTRLTLLLRSGLLGAKYNLNHKINMIILPMAEEVARGLSLPRHLIGPQKVGGETRSHANYSDKVKQRLGAVMDDYKELLEKKEEGHPAPPDDLSKKKLEKCSADVYDAIKSFGQAHPGQALSTMPADLFKAKP